MRPFAPTLQQQQQQQEEVSRDGKPRPLQIFGAAATAARFQGPRQICIGWPKSASSRAQLRLTWQECVARAESVARRPRLTPARWPSLQQRLTRVAHARSSCALQYPAAFCALSRKLWTPICPPPTRSKVPFPVAVIWRAKGNEEGQYARDLRTCEKVPVHLTRQVCLLSVNPEYYFDLCLTGANPSAELWCPE